MNNPLGFFPLLKEKLSVTVTKDFDNQFWAKFNEQTQTKKLPMGWRLSVPIAAFGVACAVLFMVYRNDKEQQTQMVAQMEMLQDVELFTAFDEIPVSDEDWAVLENEG